jgi:DNA polymerase V
MGSYWGDETTDFQSPAQDYIEGVVDLRRPGRYPVRVKGQALSERGPHDHPGGHVA